ncbi:MAG: ABC transporter ATP-binding protein, partial [Planctomycetota bacterium]
KVEEFRGANEKFMRRVLRMVANKAFSRGATELLYNLGSALIVLYGCYLFIVKKAISPGDLIAFIGIIATMYRPIKSLSQSYGELAASLAGAERLFALVNLEPTVKDAPDAVSLEKVEKDIVLRDVTFRYGTDGENVLSNINLRAEVGKVYAVVGKTGAGKSTLLDLVPRFYDPVSGGIEIDGVDIRKYTQASLLDHIAIVSQDPFLFNASISENIRSGFKRITDEQVRSAAEAAHVMDFAKDKAGGLDFRVGEFGNNLSGGEKQRVTIARALAKDAEILILDEATSSLDSGTQKIVQDALEHLMKGRTTFVIAHRLSTIERADRIFVIENGKLIEEGTHAELLKKGGAYTALYGEELAAGQAREGNPE